MRYPVSIGIALLWIAVSAAVQAQGAERALARGKDERVGGEAFYLATEFWYRMIGAFGEDR
jgi:hypothetical protein